MALRLNERAYIQLLEEDLVWLRAQKHSLEKSHIETLLEYEIKRLALYKSIPDTGDRA